MSAALHADALDKRYGRTWALRGCSFELPAGRVAALVGPNGAGKTTLLHIAVGLLRPTAGELLTLGSSPWTSPALVLPRIGFLAQEVPLFRHFSVGEMVQLGRALNPGWEQGTAHAHLRRRGVPLDRQIRRLSGGQRTQVALAMALAKRPSLLLLDEPLASLDPLAREEFLQELMDAADRDGMTVLLSSHLIADLQKGSDHLIVLVDGAVQLAGDIDELLGSHRLLKGPAAGDRSWLHGIQVVSENHAEARSQVWVQGEVPPLPPGWTATPLALEELVLVYLRRAAPSPTPGSPEEARPR